MKIIWYNLVTGGYNIYVDIISTTGLITLGLLDWFEVLTRVSARRCFKRQPFGCFLNVK